MEVVTAQYLILHSWFGREMLDYQQSDSIPSVTCLVEVKQAHWAVQIASAVLNDYREFSESVLYACG